MCNNEVHELLIQEDYVTCVFCNKQIQDPGKPMRYFCWESMKLIKDNLLVCKNCGQVHDYLTAEEYIDFYENRYRIKRKSIYYRKYHIINTLSDIVQKNNIQIEQYPENIQTIWPYWTPRCGQKTAYQCKLYHQTTIWHLRNRIQVRSSYTNKKFAKILQWMVGQSLWSH